MLLASLQSSAPSKLKWCPARLESKSLLLAMTIAGALRTKVALGLRHTQSRGAWWSRRRDWLARCKSHDSFGRDFCAFCQVGRETGVQLLAGATWRVAYGL